MDVVKTAILTGGKQSLTTVTSNGKLVIHYRLNKSTEGQAKKYKEMFFEFL